MSKKLLSEAQVRRFQTLATIRPLNEMGSYNRDDEETNEELYQEEEELDMDAADEGGDEIDMDAGEEDMDEADVELDEELVEKFIEAASTIQQVADALGGSAGGEMEMGPEEPMDMDMDAGEEGGDDLELDAGGEEEEEEDEEAIMEALKGISYVPTQKEVVKVVAKRVARRLQEAKIAQRRLNRALGKK